MEIFTSLPDAFQTFTREAQRICTVASDHLTAYCAAGQSVSGPKPGVSFTATVFDTHPDKISLAHPAGQLLYNTSYDHATPDLALQELADFLSVDYPLPTENMSQEQKEEIIRLLNHPKIKRPEKTKMLLGYKQFTVERATQAITRIKQTIEEREAEPLRQLVA